MSVARITEVKSGSPVSFEDAVKQGVERANKTLKNVKGVWISSQEAVVENGKVVEFRVLMKVTFILND